ncbi:MAG: phosphatase [Ectothiorhodospiraceae bacterium]|nr:phosphatase [Ectothiorhodospiraceae bacterium]
MLNTIDLHMHTHYSDGAHSPAELMERVHAAGIRTCSITDHDTIDGIPPAMAFAEQLGITLIPGVELTAALNNRKEVHILGYYFDPGHERLRKALNVFKSERRHRAEKIVKNLAAEGIEITIDDVMKHAENAAVGRPHIAAVLFEKGYTASFVEAFYKYIGENCPAYEPKYLISPEDAVAIIADAGGLSVLAHPGSLYDEDELLRIIRSGIDGIEVVHPVHSGEHQRLYRSIASTYFLLESGGSDFHGGRREDDANLGRFNVPDSYLYAMKRRLFIS